jgi:hypothetical protein
VVSLASVTIISRNAEPALPRQARTIIHLSKQ